MLFSSGYRVLRRILRRAGATGTAGTTTLTVHRRIELRQSGKRARSRRSEPRL